MAEVARDRGWLAESVDYRGMDDPATRVTRLVGVCRAGAGPLVLAGSSMGGHVAASASRELAVAGLFLVAPAFHMPGYEALTPTPRAERIVVIHGWRDGVVPVENSVRWARARAATLHLLDGDHRLTDRLFEINRLFDAFLHDVAADLEGRGPADG